MDEWMDGWVQMQREASLVLLVSGQTEIHAGLHFMAVGSNGPH